jgi:short-subunit dehydrogenase
VPNSKLAGKIVWVTGASSGIGEALAYDLAKRGASLILSARREDALANIRDRCANPDRHLVLPLDMLQPESFAPAVQTALNRFGRIDILIHCAGISQRGTAIKTELKVDRHLIDVNYLGPVALTKQVLPSIIAARGGQIVVVSSLLGKFSVPKRAAYSASKHALHGFFDSLRAELDKKDIAVTIVCPGYVRSNASFNALEGDGTPHNELDPEIASGMTCEECARRIIRAVECRRREVYIGRREIFGLYLSRFAPGLFSRLIRLKQRD